MCFDLVVRLSRPGVPYHDDPVSIAGHQELTVRTDGDGINRTPSRDACGGREESDATYMGAQ
jgi:hypothetical protein